MRIALVRHGQTSWNVADLLQGSSDIPLNDTGRAQAREAAGLLAGAHWDAIVTSPLVRAVETAGIIADALDLARPETSIGLVERDYGEAEGLTKEQATARFGAVWPGEESYEHLKERAVTAVDAVAANHSGTALIIATHGTFIRAFADVIVGQETIKPDNAHAVWFDGESGNWTVTRGLRLVSVEG